MLRETIAQELLATHNHVHRHFKHSGYASQVHSSRSLRCAGNHPKKNQITSDPPILQSEAFKASLSALAPVSPAPSALSSRSSLLDYYNDTSMMSTSGLNFTYLFGTALIITTPPRSSLCFATRLAIHVPTPFVNAVLSSSVFRRSGCACTTYALSSATIER